MSAQIIKINAKDIFTKTKLKGAMWVLNPYVGCLHGCLYCYAKFMAIWRPGSYGKWGAWVEAKINGPEIVKGKKIKGWVFASSICDPYQPVERKLKLFRKILENMDKDIKLAVQTKSNLILRDIDVLQKFKTIEIGFTINSFTDKAKKLFEPNSSGNLARIKALQKIKKAGFRTYIFVSPIIPGLTDLESVVNRTKKYADYYWFEFINLRGAGKDFTEVLKKQFPASYNIVADEKKYQKFVVESTKIIKKCHIEIRGIVKH